MSDLVKKDEYYDDFSKIMSLFNQSVALIINSIEKL